MAAYVVSGELGVDVFAQVDDLTTQVHPLGKVVTLSDGTRWIYLKASATIAQYDACVSVDNATTQGLTSTLGLRGMSISFEVLHLTQRRCREKDPRPLRGMRSILGRWGT